MKKYEVTMYEMVAIKIYVEAESEQDAICHAIEINNCGCYDDGSEVADGVYHRTSDAIDVQEFNWKTIDQPYGITD
jgi:hypothetical protein